MTRTSNTGPPEIASKRLERITERIGAERLVEVDQAMAAFQALTLMNPRTHRHCRFPLLSGR